MFQQYNYPSDGFALYGESTASRPLVTPKRAVVALFNLILIIILIAVTTIMILALAGVFESDDKSNSTNKTTTATTASTTTTAITITTTTAVTTATTTTTTTTLASTRLSCGQQSIQPSINGNELNVQRIIRGSDAVPNSWPWMVSIRYILPNDGGLAHNCGGSLIYDDIVLTVSHCIPLLPANFTIFVGLHDVNSTVSNEFIESAKDNVYEIKAHAYHVNYTSSILRNDIALIKLSRPVKLSSKVNLICLPNSPEETDIVLNKSVVIAGWGSTTGERMEFAKKLQQTKIDVIDDQATCSFNIKLNETSNFEIHDPLTQYCLLDTKNQSNACFGDSGGPMMYFEEDRWYIFGLTSYGRLSNNECNNTLPSYYTKVPYYLDWINRARKLLDNSTEEFLLVE
jgi:secreted trypsin-like serine protease